MPRVCECVSLQSGSQVGYQYVTINVINVPDRPPRFTSSLTATVDELETVCVRIPLLL